MGSFSEVSPVSPVSPENHYEELFEDIIQCCDEKEIDPQKLGELRIEVDTFINPEKSIPISLVKKYLYSRFSELEDEARSFKRPERIKELSQRIKILIKILQDILNNKNTAFQQAIYKILELNRQISNVIERFRMDAANDTKAILRQYGLELVPKTNVTNEAINEILKYLDMFLEEYVAKENIPGIRKLLQAKLKSVCEISNIDEQMWVFKDFARFIHEIIVDILKTEAKDEDDIDNKNILSSIVIDNPSFTRLNPKGIGSTVIAYSIFHERLQNS